MQIGRLIRQHRLSVKVSKFCLTACAHYVFAAGHNNTIADGAVVGLHAGVIPLLRLTVSDLQAATPLTEQEAHWTRELLAQYTSILAVQGGEKQAFERDMGLDAALIARMEAATAPHGINLSEVTGKGFALSGKKGHCDLWVPDQEGWRQMGVRVTAFTRPGAPTIARLVKIDATRVSVLSDPMSQADPVWCDNQRAPVEMDVRFNASQQQRDGPPPTQ